MSLKDSIREYRGKGITTALEQRIAALEAALAKHHAVHEAWAAWIDDFPGYDDTGLAPVRAAIREALK